MITRSIAVRMKAALRPRRLASKSQDSAGTAAAPSQRGPAESIAQPLKPAGKAGSTADKLAARESYAARYKQTRSFEDLHKLRAATADCLRKDL